ncbi:hypothetical protein HF086_008110 [Spodoptera exigua]|uniref:HECT-type E3 ubiquitin transferase n=1 Tax=Spodoptera exigua TaxID=7107 RepID=A0A922MMI3_SPOEX|nr:hypothetical protein HF086_008110 [Spodoptera exigua]
MCFTVHCFQRNGQPYPICDTDELTVAITHGSRKVTAVIELGSGDPAQANTARVKFTVRQAGVYIVSVMIGLVPVAGSPFRKWFTAGRVEARRSRVGRAHHALVFAAQHARALHVHPRDHYDNPAPLTDHEVPALIPYTSDTATVQRNISSKRHNICYEARLLSGKPRRVLCCISPKQLTLKDYLFKFIPKRITSFRLCPSTKLILKPTPLGSGPGGEFTLEDGVQPQLELVSAERDLIAATFTQLLIANCGGEDTFKNKQDFFYSEIRKAHSRYPHEKLAIRVVRSELLRSSLKATRHFTVQDWCKNFDITFQGEQGVDWGGVRREWFSLLCGQLFDPKFGLFVSFHDSPTGLVHPNPDRPPHLKLKHFELAGKLVGKCVYESVSVTISVCPQLKHFELAGKLVGKCVYESVSVTISVCPQLKHFELAGKLVGKCVYESVSVTISVCPQLKHFELAGKLVGKCVYESVSVTISVCPQLKHFELAGKLVGKCVYESVSVTISVCPQLKHFELAGKLVGKCVYESVSVTISVCPQLKHFELAGKLVGKCVYESLKHFELAGKLVGKCVYESVSVTISVCPQLKHFELAGKLVGKCVYESVSVTISVCPQLKHFELAGKLVGKCVYESVSVTISVCPQLKHFELAGKLVGKCVYESLKHFELAGKLVGKCVYESVSVTISVCPQLKHFELAGKLVGKCVYESVSVTISVCPQLKHFELAGKLVGKCVYESLKHFELAGKLVGKCVYESVSVTISVCPQLKHFELAGKLVGKCVYESVSVTISVCPQLKHFELAGKLVGKCVCESLKHFELAGKLVGKCVYESVSVTISVCPQLKHFELAGKLVGKCVYESVSVTISVCPQLKHFELAGKLVGKCVYESISYLDALAQWRLAARVRAETEAFLRGLGVLVPDNLLAIFDENELELLLCGTGELAVQDWRAHALVQGAGRDWERVLAWFWAALSSFTTEERAPPNFGALPTAHTCFNQLCLPDYDSYEQLVHALLWAINEGGEGFGMI